MLTNDAVRHEETEPRAALLGREVRLEQAVAMLIGDTRTVVGDAEVRSAVAPAGDRRLGDRTAKCVAPS